MFIFIYVKYFYKQMTIIIVVTFTGLLTFLNGSAILYKKIQ